MNASSTSDLLEKVGRKLWLVEVMAGQIEEAPSQLPRDATVADWKSEMCAVVTGAKNCVEGLKQSLNALPPELINHIAEGFRKADEEAQAQDTATMFLSKIQDEQGRIAKEARAKKGHQ